jgi:hypothetical protein
VRAISPDGRWLVFLRGDRLALHDLTTAAERDLGPDEGTWVGGWSPNNRWLALQVRDSADAAQITTSVLDLESFRRIALPPGRYQDAAVCGLGNTGELMLCAADSRSTRFRLWRVDGSTGQESRQDGRTAAVVDPSAAMTDTERRADWVSPPGVGWSGLLLHDGRTLVVRTNTYRADRGLTLPGDLIAVDVDNPRATPRRYELPAATLGKEYPNPAGGGVNIAPGDEHRAVAAADEGLLVAHIEPSRHARLDEQVTELALLDPVTGKLGTVTQVATSVKGVLLPGQYPPE